MGRKPKLTARNKAEILRRLTAGERAVNIAREFEVSEGLISQLFSKEIPNIKTLASTLANTELAISKLDKNKQGAVRTMADQLKDIESSYASGAAAGARSADRLHGLADRASARLVRRAEEEDGLDPKDVALVSALHQTANQGAVMASNMLAANKAQAAPALPVERPRPDLSKLTKKELAELERLTRKAENV